MSDPLRRLAFVTALILPWIAVALPTAVTEARTDAGE
jgi:hypothetical protein